MKHYQKIVLHLKGNFLLGEFGTIVFFLYFCTRKNMMILSDAINLINK